MKTDWDLVRSMMEAAIGTCEELETMGYAESHRDIMVETERGKTSVQDWIVSAWTFPENMRYRIIRERHDAGADLPYVHEFCRILTGMAQACAELVGGKDAAPAQASLQDMLTWYREHAVPTLRRAIEDGGRRA